MSDKPVLKKSLFGGFRKKDVIDYIEKLQSENVSFKRELENRSESFDDSQALRAELDALRADYDSLKKDYTELADKKSGTVVQDAVNYSESLVDAARESAAGILAKANEAVAGACAGIREAKSGVQSAKNNIDNQLDSVQSDLDSLAEKLAACLPESEGE